VWPGCTRLGVSQSLTDVPGWSPAVLYVGRVGQVGREVADAGGVHGAPERLSAGVLGRFELDSEPGLIRGVPGLAEPERAQQVGREVARPSVVVQGTEEAAIAAALGVVVIR
jgi:hypothetical protein